MDDGVKELGSELVLALGRWRRGEEGRWRTIGVLNPRFGELFLSESWRSGRTDVRVGETGGYISSTGFRKDRCRCGEPFGLWGRGMRMWPSPFTPGMDWARPMGGGARVAADLDLTWLPDNGEVVRGRYGRAAAFHVGEIGEEGEGSVERRMAGGFRGDSDSEVRDCGL